MFVSFVLGTTLVVKIKKNAGIHSEHAKKNNEDKGEHTFTLFTTGSDNGDPFTGLFVAASCKSRSSHGQVHLPTRDRWGRGERGRHS